MKFTKILKSRKRDYDGNKFDDNGVDYIYGNMRTECLRRILQIYRLVDFSYFIAKYWITLNFESYAIFIKKILEILQISN